MLISIAGRGVPIFGVTYKDTKDEALRFLVQYGLPLVAMGADTQGRMAFDWGVCGVPETYVMDGRAKVQLPELITPETWKRKIAPLIGKRSNI